MIDAGFRLRPDFRYVMDGEFYARLDAAGKPSSASRGGGGFPAPRRQRIDDPPRENPRDGRILAAERQHVESRAIRRAYGITLFADPYLNGLVDGVLWIAARAWKQVLKG